MMSTDNQTDASDAGDLCSVAAELLECERVVLWRPSSGAGELIPAVSVPSGAVDADGALSCERPENHDSSVLAFHSRRPVAQYLSAGDSVEIDGVGLGADTVSTACWPIIRNAEPVAVLSCYWQGRRELGARDVRMLERLSRMLRRMHADLDVTVRAEEARATGALARALTQLLAILAGSQRSIAEQIARLLSNHLETAIVILDANGDVTATAGRPSVIETMTAALADPGDSAARYQRVTIPASGTSSADAAPAGWILMAEQGRPGQVVAAELIQCSALALSAYGAWTGEQPLVEQALAPLMLLAVSRPQAGEPRLRLAYGLFGLTRSSELHVAIVDAATPEGALRVSARSSSLRRAGIRLITAVAEESRVLLLLRGAPDRALVAAIDETMPSVRAAGVSRGFQGLEDLPFSIAQAESALAVGRSVERVVFSDEIDRSLDLLARVPAPQASEWVESLLMPLRTAEGVGERRLFEIVEAFLAADGSYGEGARSLGIDTETLEAAIGRSSELIDADLESPTGRSILAMALAWDRIAARDDRA